MSICSQKTYDLAGELMKHMRRDKSVGCEVCAVGVALRS